jgi:hypothetical protein
MLAALDNMPEVIERLQAVPPQRWLAAGLSIVGGTAMLFYGWRLYRVGLVIAGAAAGAVGALHTSDWLGDSFQWQIGHETAAVVGMILGALAAWPLEKLAVCLIGGSAGALLFVSAALHVWPTNPRLAGILFALGALAFIVAAYLATGIRQMMVIIATSLWGSTALLWFPMIVLLVRRAPDGARPTHPLREFPQMMLMVTMGLWLTMAAFGIFVQSRREIDPEFEERRKREEAERRRREEDDAERRRSENRK